MKISRSCGSTAAATRMVHNLYRKGPFEALADVKEGDAVSIEDRFLIDIGDTLEKARAQLAAFLAVRRQIPVF
jgi:hypothetical protein